MRYIPQIEPWIGQEELAELAKVIESTYITESSKTVEFLEGIKHITASPFAIATSNGTVALVASLLASGIGPGDSVIVPDLTFIASCNAIRLVGAKPLICDVDKETGCMSLEEIEKIMTPSVKAIMPVHLYGQIADMPELVKFASAHNVDIIEDAAEALGVTLDSKAAGTFGRFGVFSFYANKIVTCGEGGVILCQNEQDYKTLYRIKNHGRDRKGIFVHETIGYNFCFTDLQAAVGVAQLNKFERMMQGKRRIYEQYLRELQDVKSVRIVQPPKHITSNYWFINILVDNPSNLAVYLEAKGIGTRRFFNPLCSQPCNEDLHEDLKPNSKWLFDHGLSLPSSPLLRHDEIKWICDSVRSFVENCE